MTIIKVKANSYNDFCMKLRNMMIYDVNVRVGGTRYQMFDRMTGKKVAEYNEKRDHGLVYNYNLGRA